MVIVRFRVGEDEAPALRSAQREDRGQPGSHPAGASTPLVKARSIDDVPVMAAVTLSGDTWDDLPAAAVAAEIQDGLKEVPDVSGSDAHRGASPADPGRAWIRRGSRRTAWTSGRCAMRRWSRTERTRSGEPILEGEVSISSRLGAGPNTPPNLAGTVVGGAGGPISSRRRRRAGRRTSEPHQRYVTHHTRDGRTFPAVTIVIAKRVGTNADGASSRCLEQKLDT